MNDNTFRNKAWRDSKVTSESLNKTLDIINKMWEDDVLIAKVIYLKNHPRGEIIGYGLDVETE